MSAQNFDKIKDHLTSAFELMGDADEATLERVAEHLRKEAASHRLIAESYWHWDLARFADRLLQRRRWPLFQRWRAA